MEYLKFDVIKNGIFVPEGFVSKQDIVYDDNFEIVLDSCVLRGNNKSENVTNPPQHLPYEITKDIESIDGRLLFMGQFIRENGSRTLLTQVHPIGKKQCSLSISILTIFYVLKNLLGLMKLLFLSAQCITDIKFTRNT
jgi:hypothetical protein